MVKNKKRQGFTLVEVLVASAISAVIFGQLSVTLVTSQRLLQETMGDMELALSGRLLREKLLFKVNDNGGLLSGQKALMPATQRTAGTSASYTPYNRSVNKLVARTSAPLFKATTALSDNWFVEGAILLGSDQVFTCSNNTISASMDLKLQVGNHVYFQNQKFDAPAMCMIPAN